LKDPDTIWSKAWRLADDPADEPAEEEEEKFFIFLFTFFNTA
jgi:hypothetical protein